MEQSLFRDASQFDVEKHKAFQSSEKDELEKRNAEIESWFKFLNEIQVFFLLNSAPKEMYQIINRKCDRVIFMILKIRKVLITQTEHSDNTTFLN